MPAPPTAALPTRCPNCGEPVAERGPLPPGRYCVACGQETQVQAPTLREFAQQFGGAYLSTEGALWRTLKLLLTQPGELTRQYLAGRRKHYVLPLRLYLTTSVLVLLLARVLGSTGAVDVNLKLDDDGPTARPRSFTILGLGDEGRGIGFADGVFYCNTVPAWVCKRVQRRFSADTQGMASELSDFKDRMVGNLGGGLFMMLPSFALLMKLAYLNRRMRYTEHLVFALHLHAFWFLVLALTLLKVPFLTGLVMLGLPLYAFLAMRRVYGGRWWPRLLRGAAVTLVYFVVLSLALALVAVWSLLA